VAHLNLMVLSAPAPRTPTVMVVEDDDIIRLTTADFLESCGYIVLQAASVTAAKRWFDSHAIDLVFTDIEMPGGLNGIDLAEWVQTNYPNIPVIVTSGVAAHAAFGLAPMIKKPYALEELQSRIQSALAQEY